MAIASCSSAKKIAETLPASNSTSATHAKKAESQSLIQFPQFTTLNAAKCKLTLSLREKSYTVPTSVKIVKDSLVQISIMPLLGIEMYRAVLSPDSVTIIDKNNRNYFVTDYSFFKQRFGVEIGFKDVQALLTNHTLNTENEDGAANLQKNENGYEWATTYKDLSANYLFSNDYRLAKTMLKQPSSEAQFNCSYDNFTAFDAITFPTQCAIEATSDQKHGGFTFVFDKITFNAPLTLNTLNLSNYNRVGFEQILPF